MVKHIITNISNVDYIKGAWESNFKLFAFLDIAKIDFQ